MNSDFGALSSALAEMLGAGASSRWSPGVFEQWAATVFRHQYGHCEPYRRFCELRGITPESVSRWEDIPSVPAAAFKAFDLLSVPDHERFGPEAVFRTSGTTRGLEARGRHPVPRLDLYRASLREPFRAALLPDLEERRIVFLSMVPPPSQVPHSSLSFMVADAAETFGAECHWLVDADGGWSGSTRDVLDRVVAVGEPVLALGTALAFAHLVEARPDLFVALPDGSRVMETGGFKGVRRSVPRESLYEGIGRALGVHPDRIVNEYGMTELLSQLYEPILSEGPGVRGLHVPPPWLRVRALDPETLAPRPDGEDGILAFFDLANLGSVSHVLTEDVGCIEDGRVRLRGRVPGAEPRGCSRAMDDLMTAAVTASSGTRGPGAGPAP